MEPQLTIAIPTMRRWNFFLERSLPIYLQCSFVKYVLICDETGEDIEAILKSPFAKSPKLILHKNSRRLGIYHNKRQCIALSPTEWVAVLDSDNFFDVPFFETLEKIWKTEGADLKKFYACGKALFLHEDGKEVYPLEGFGGTTLDASSWNAFFEKPKWNYMLNDGNWVVPKSVLECLPRDVKDEDILATDAIYMARLFVQGGYTYDIRQELSYIHMVHKGSSWTSQSTENNRIWKSTNWKL